MSERRIVTAAIGMPAKYRARVFPSMRGVIFRYPCFRYQIERGWAGVWSNEGGQSRPFNSRESAEAAANEWLDEVSAEPPGEYVSREN